MESSGTMRAAQAAMTHQISIERADQKLARYSVVLAWDGDARAWSAEVPAFDGIATCGGTVDEALAMAREIIELHIEYRRDRGEPLPVEDVSVQVHQIDVSAG